MCRTGIWAPWPTTSTRRSRALDGKLPKATHIVLRGQVQTMLSSYTGLAIGVVGAMLLVYLLIVINFQSWTDPFIIITALPAAHRRHRLDAAHHRHHARACRP